jgi:hypothetical protein
MTRDEILKMDHLKTAEVKPGMFVHVHAEDDYRITSFNPETDDIKNYSGSICMFMPIRDSYDDDYRVITVAEHEEFERQAREANEAANL